MKQVTVTYNVYEFDELGKDAKQRAIEFACALLNANKIIPYKNPRLHKIWNETAVLNHARQYWYSENGDIFSPAEPKHEWTAEEIIRREG